MYRTPELREHNAAWGVMGQVLEEVNLAPGIAYPSDALTVSGKCPQKLVNVFTSYGDVHVFAYVMHAHLLGRKIVTDQWRDGERVAQWRNDPYSFNYQHAVMGEWTIRPNDWFNTTCWYDSTERSQPTLGGLASTDEMWYVCCTSMRFYFTCSNASTPSALHSLPSGATIRALPSGVDAVV